jgi:hypothetical protein
MPFKYSLFVNGRHLGPYERRMIVGMRVKNLVTDNQLVQRHDGLDMTVAELMKDRDESAKYNAAYYEASPDSQLHAPSSGMWPQFSVRFGGGPMKAGALGFNGSGTVAYHGDELRFKGNRRNSNFGMTRQEERLPVRAIESSMADDGSVELVLKPGFGPNASDHSQLVRFELANQREATELWELLNMRSGELPDHLAFAQTARTDLS